MSFETSNTADNFKINVTGDISCKNEESIGGKIISGITIDATDANNIKIKSAQCSDIRLKDNIADLPKGTVLNNICDCELVDGLNGVVNCPDNKFLRTYYPAIKKGLCCSPCTSDSKLKSQYVKQNCNFIPRVGNENIMKCPDNTYMQNISIGGKVPSIECCYPTPAGEIFDKDKQQKNECKQYGLKSCSSDDIVKLKDACKLYGLAQCTADNLDKLQQRCNQYEMRYMDYKTNKYVHAESPIVCYNDNFNKIDEKCRKNNIKVCNVPNAYDYDNKIRELSNNIQTVDNDQYNKINQLSLNIVGLDQVQQEHTEMISSVKNSFIVRFIELLKRPFMTILYIIFITLMILGVIAMIIIKRRSSNVAE